MAVLLREAIGDRLRHARTAQQRTLREVARTALVSPGYLSEIERGRKEASSELLAAICTALELSLADLMRTVASDLGAIEKVELDAARLEQAHYPTQNRIQSPKLSASVSRYGDLKLQPLLTRRLPNRLMDTVAPV